MAGADDDDDWGEPIPEMDPPSGAPAPDPDADARLIEAAKLPLNDHGNGQRFGLHFGVDCMFVPRVGWHVWDGRVWQKDPDQLAVRGFAQALAARIAAEIRHLVPTRADADLIAALPDLKARVAELRAIPAARRDAAQKRDLAVTEHQMIQAEAASDALDRRRRGHARFANQSGNSGRIDNALREGGVALAVAHDALDPNPLDINTETGTLRFTLTEMREDGATSVADVALRAHDRQDRLTKLAAVPYDPAATAPGFDAFLRRIQPDASMRGFLQRWFGLSMTALPMQKLVFLYGNGANGKSVLVDLIARTLGNYAATARIESLTGFNRRGGGDATPDLIPLMGARLVRTSEPDEGQRLQEGLIKELTGGEPILMRGLHADFIEVRPFFKLTMSGNHKPEIQGTDDGIWRRVLLVPFDVQIPEGERDLNFGDRLFAAEAPGILNWLRDGLIDYLEGGLQPPEAVIAATTEYRQESDPIGVFLAECCVVTGDPADVILATDVLHGFALHTAERGMGVWKDRKFSLQMSDKAGKWRDPATGRQFAKGKSSRAQYVGLRFTDVFKARLENAPRDGQGRPLPASPRTPFDHRTGG